MIYLFKKIKKTNIWKISTKKIWSEIVLSSNQKNFILGLITVVVLVVLGVFVYKTLGVSQVQPQESKIEALPASATPPQEVKLVAGLNIDQYIPKWCEFNSQDPFACLENIQACRADKVKSNCDQVSFQSFTESWNNNKNPDTQVKHSSSAAINQKVLANYCEDFSSEPIQQCVSEMNACFDNTSSDKSCKDYVRNFNIETNNGKSYGDLNTSSQEKQPASLSLENIMNGSSNIPQIKACKGNANCNTFHALAENWKLIPNNSEYKALASSGDGYGLWKGYYYTEDRIYELAEAGEAAFYRGGSASPKEERLFGQGLAVLLYLQGPQNF